MKITISDTSFHKKIKSRYGKGFRIIFPSMFFLKCTRNFMSRIIDMHVRLNFHIHNKYMGVSSVLLQKFQNMTSGFCEINKILIVLFQKLNTFREKRIFNFPKNITRASNFPVIDTVLSARTINDNVLNYSITKNFFSSNSSKNNIFLNYSQNISNTTIPSGIVDRRSFCPIAAINNYSKPANYSHPNYLQKFNNVIPPGILNKRTFNYQTAAYNYFTSGRMGDNQISNYVQAMSYTTILSRIMGLRPFYHSVTINYPTQTKPVNHHYSNYLQTFNNIILPGILNKRTLNYQTATSYPNVLNDPGSLDHLRTKYLQTVYGGNNFTLRSNRKNLNVISKEILYDHIKDTHKRIVFSPGRSIHFGSIIQSMPENGINGLNNNTAGADIVFRKPHIENKITGEKKQPNEKTISAKIRADKQIKNVPAHQGEISSIANKVYKLLERRLSIEKEKRGVHIIG